MRSFITLTVAAALAWPGAAATAEDPLWSAPLALGPTDATSVAGRDGLVLAGGRALQKDDFQGNPEEVAGPRTPGLFRSTDRGQTWELGLERVVESDGSTTFEPITTTPDLVGAPPAGPDAYAVFGTEVWRSDDDAATWRPVGTLPSPASAIDFLRDGRPVVGLASGGLRASGDRGATWTALGTGLPSSRVNEVLHRSDSVILVATQAGLYRSGDTGGTFTQVTSGLPSPSSPALGIAGDGTLGTYLAMPGNAPNSTLIYGSANEGSGWQPRPPIYSQNLLPRVSPGALELVVQGSIPVLYAGTSVGLFRTDVTAATAAVFGWERLDPEPGARAVGDLAFEDTDPGTTRNHVVYGAVSRASIAVSAAAETHLAAPGWYDELEGGRVCGGLVARADNVLFAACGRHVFRSGDGGATWTGVGGASTGGAAAPARSLPYVSAGLADSPYMPLVGSPDGSLWTSGFHYGLYHSNPEVTEWTKIAFPAASVGPVATHPTDPDVVFAAGLATNGCCTVVLHRSTDAGLTWTKAIPDAGTNIYSIDVSDGAPDNVLVAAYSNGVWHSADGGDSWTEATGIFGNVYRAGYSAATPTRAWAITSDGVYRSDDSGATWTGVGPVSLDGEDQTTFQIAASPWNADHVYAMTVVGDLLVTRDAGLTWEALDQGLPKDPDCSICEVVGNLTFHPAERGRLFATAGVMGAGAAPQDAWVVTATDPEA